MVYYDDGVIAVRDMESGDVQAFYDGEVAQGWKSASTDKYLAHLRHQSEGLCVALTATYRGEPVGYNNLYWNRPGAGVPGDGPFAGTGIPEISDFAVLEKVRRRGVGARLMDVAEQLAATACDRVSIGVGLHAGYGSAQRMYVKRGYVPDGSGVWFNGKPAEPYAPCMNDDALILYLSKGLKETPA